MVVVDNHDYLAPLPTLPPGMCELLLDKYLASDKDASLHMFRAVNTSFDDLSHLLVQVARCLDGAARAHVTLVFSGHATIAASGALYLDPVDAGFESTWEGKKRFAWCMLHLVA